MKKIKKPVFKKNQIIVTALAAMIAVAVKCTLSPSDEQIAYICILFVTQRPGRFAKDGFGGLPTDGQQGDHTQ